MLRHKTITVKTSEELIVASKDPSIIAIKLEPGDYGWVVLSDASGINITSADPSKQAIFRHLGFYKCREMSVSAVHVRFGATENPDARAVEFHKCRNIVLDGSRIEGNPATKKWADVPIGVLIDGSTGIRLIKLSIRHVSSVVRARGSRNLRLTRSAIGPVLDANMPRSVEVDECVLSDAASEAPEPEVTYSPRWGIVPGGFETLVKG